jgi:hypothetical protein
MKGYFITDFSVKWVNLMDEVIMLVFEYLQLVLLSR